MRLLLLNKRTNSVNGLLRTHAAGVGALAGRAWWSEVGALALRLTCVRRTLSALRSLLASSQSLL